MHINKYETTGFEELKLDGKFRFDEATLTVSWIFQGKRHRLIFDEEEVFKQFCLQYQMYESQSAQLLARSTASLSASTNSLGSSPGLGLSMHRSASSSLFLFGSPRSATSDESAAPPMSSSVESGGTDHMSSSSLLSQSSLGSTPVQVSSNSSAAAIEVASGSAPAAVSVANFFPSESPSATAAASPSSVGSGSLLSRSASSKSKLFDDLDDYDTDEFDEPKTFKMKRRSNSTAKPSQSTSSRPSNGSPVKRRVVPPTAYKLDDDPYAHAIKTLKRLNGYRSPREKVECALKALNQTVQAITSFWKQYKKDIIVGADDLVPIFGYVVLRAAVPAIYFEMNVRIFHDPPFWHSC
jgi:hypothetical protein